MNFRVWAPLAEKVELVFPDASVGMAKEDKGWWQTEVSGVAEGIPYRYRIDGEGPYPDPRSLWQPQGVHGASAVLDLEKLRNRPRPPFRQAHLRDAVIYELHTGTFTPEGTYAAAITRLPHLVSLGITHVEILPVASFPGRRGWGYDGVCLYAPYAPYGTPFELAAFVDACHAHGLAVLLDVVYNHLGPDGNYLACYGPCFTTHVATPWGQAVNLDGPWSDGVREFIIDNALMWLRDYGFDGLRLDAVHELYDSRALPILEELALRVRELEAPENRPFILVAESNLNNPRLIHAPEKGGWGLDAHWADELHHTIHVLLTGEQRGYYADFSAEVINDLGRTLADGYLYTGQYSPSRLRCFGRPPEGVEPHQLIVCCQNHDQTGNRAFGERIGMLVSPEKARTAAALTILSPWVPMLFQGEEWDAKTPFLFFSDHESKELREAVCRSRREEFKAFAWDAEVPDPGDPASFKNSKLDWNEPDSGYGRAMLTWYRQLIRLRQRTGGASPGSTTVQWDETAGWLTLRRGPVLAVFNLSPDAQIISLPDGSWQPLTPEHTPGTPLPPWTTALYEASV